MRAEPEAKTVIGILASHDNAERNNALARLFDRLYEIDRTLLGKFQFVFTGGTFDRILDGGSRSREADIRGVNADTRNLLLASSTALPRRVEGGVTILSYLVVERVCPILWTFFTPFTPHWLGPENLALMRLADQWRAKRLMNSGSVEEWFRREAEHDAGRHSQPMPLSVRLGSSGEKLVVRPRPGGGLEIDRPTMVQIPDSVSRMTIALIAHDEMKPRMVEFAVDHEAELAQFGRIISTGTTGRDVGEAAPRLRDKIHRYSSGPKGGDIEIATEILFGSCHVVVFFVDPLHPHPHIEDIRVVFGACMVQDQVRMLTNEMQAREWMDRVVRRQARDL
jgi:methylglyoxal synthase